MRYQFVDCRWELGKPERGRELYLDGHIPGASFLDVDTDLSSPPGRTRQTSSARPTTVCVARQREQVSATASSSSPTGTWAAPSGCGGCCATSATTSAR